MDMEKCCALKDELSDQPEPQFVSIDRFFDGNDDLGSIGCNLADHPGVPAFRKILEGLLKRPDVEGVWAQIAELDPDEDLWPFTDTVLVAGTITANELRKQVEQLQPDIVSQAATSQPRPGSAAQSTPLLVIWWD